MHQHLIILMIKNEVLSGATRFKVLEHTRATFQTYITVFMVVEYLQIYILVYSILPTESNNPDTNS